MAHTNDTLPVLTGASTFPHDALLMSSYDKHVQAQGFGHVLLIEARHRLGRTRSEREYDELGWQISDRPPTFTETLDAITRAAKQEEGSDA